jgi:hypothetical protein
MEIRCSNYSCQSTDIKLIQKPLSNFFKCNDCGEERKIAEYISEIRADDFAMLVNAGHFDSDE